MTPVAARRRTVVRRRATALAVLVAVGVGAAVVVVGARSPHSSAPPAIVRVELGGRVLARRGVSELQRPRSVAALLSAVPPARTVRRGPSTVELRVDRREAARAVDRAVRRGGGAVVVRERPTATRIRVPIVQQALRDNCETAALSMILAFRGKQVDQLALQSQVAHSPPLDPTVSAEGPEVWGDPNMGFVGRADGGGPAGGFGVYQRPIQALARRHGVALRDLTGAGAAVLYRALLQGHPVMAWVALSDGPFATWRTLSGRTVRVNYGEHALVLTGVGPTSVRVNDPLSGRRLTWTKAEFEQMWTALGRRALSA
jgi:uncharacterized protein YvpB